MKHSRPAQPNPTEAPINENEILIPCDEMEWQPTFPGGWI
jgi:hypothetical protein